MGLRVTPPPPRRAIFFPRLFLQGLKVVPIDNNDEKHPETHDDDQRNALNIKRHVVGVENDKTDKNVCPQLVKAGRLNFVIVVSSSGGGGREGGGGRPPPFPALVRTRPEGHGPIPLCLPPPPPPIRLSRVCWRSVGGIGPAPLLHSPPLPVAGVPADASLKALNATKGLPHAEACASLVLAPPPPPPLRPCPQTKGTVVGDNDICRWESLVGPFLVHNLFGGPSPPSSPTPPNTPLKHSPGHVGECCRVPVRRPKKGRVPMHALGRRALPRWWGRDAVGGRHAVTDGIREPQNMWRALKTDANPKPQSARQRP